MIIPSSFHPFKPFFTDEYLSNRSYSNFHRSFFHTAKCQSGYKVLL